MSWRPEVFVDGAWYPNAIRFATEGEAAEYAKDLYHRWTLTRDHRAVESPDPINYTYKDGALQSTDPLVGNTEKQP